LLARECEALTRKDIELALAPDSADAHLTYGMVLFAMRAPERALREFEFSVSLAASLATAHAYLGLMKVFLGRARETRAHVAEAMRLSPRRSAPFSLALFHRGCRHPSRTNGSRA
jgi:hypothetical protein